MILLPPGFVLLFGVVLQGVADVVTVEVMVFAEVVLPLLGVPQQLLALLLKWLVPRAKWLVPKPVAQLILKPAWRWNLNDVRSVCVSGLRGMPASSLNRTLVEKGV